jgi:hypothetical protein
MTGNSPLVDFRRPSEYGPPRIHLAAVGLYASTPAYREVFGLYDLGDLADRLRLMSRAGQWDAMGELIDDDLLAEFSVEAPPRRRSSRNPPSLRRRARSRAGLPALSEPAGAVGEIQNLLMERSVIFTFQPTRSTRSFRTKGFGSLELAGSRVAGAAHDSAIGHADNQS